jgi:hypothetical protein
MVALDHGFAAGMIRLCEAWACLLGGVQNEMDPSSPLSLLTLWPCESGARKTGFGGQTKNH